MKRQFRFLLSDQKWTRWYSDNGDLTFLRNNCEVMGVEISEEMTREEFDRQFPGNLTRDAKPPQDR